MPHRRGVILQLIQIRQLTGIQDGTRRPAPGTERRRTDPTTIPPSRALPNSSAFAFGHKLEDRQMIGCPSAVARLAWPLRPDNACCVWIRDGPSAIVLTRFPY